MKRKNDPRHQSRIIALQKLFEYEFKSNTPYEIRELRDIIREDDSDDDISVDEQFVQAILQGVAQHMPEIDQIISNYTVKRPFEETSKIDLLILRIAVYEMLFAEKRVPFKVVIDEAVELAKEFGGERSFTFINGVLGNISSSHAAA